MVVSTYEVSFCDRLRSCFYGFPKAKLHARCTISAAKPKFVLGATLVPNRPNVLRGLALRWLRSPLLPG